MFEDLIEKHKKHTKIFQFYICEHADKCNADYCLHKEPHCKTELGRPYQPDHEDPCDCTIHGCKYFVVAKGQTLCKPIP